MKIEYTPSRVETYTTPDRFQVVCEDSLIGMRVYGDTVLFLGWDRSGAQWSAYHFDSTRMPVTLLQDFMTAYNNRGKS